MTLKSVTLGTCEFGNHRDRRRGEEQTVQRIQGRQEWRKEENDKKYKVKVERPEGERSEVRKGGQKVRGKKEGWRKTGRRRTGIKVRRKEGGLGGSVTGSRTKLVPFLRSALRLLVTSQELSFPHSVPWYRWFSIAHLIFNQFFVIMLLSLHPPFLYSSLSLMLLLHSTTFLHSLSRLCCCSTVYITTFLRASPR